MKMIGIIIKLKKISRMTIDRFIISILIYLTVAHFYATTPPYNYKHIPKHYLSHELYKKALPIIMQYRDFPDCNYHDILASNATEDVRNITKITKENLEREKLQSGTFMPEICNPVYSVAIIVPYKNRKKQLDVFLPYIHYFLMMQKIHYRVYLVEQQDNYDFNKGILYNIGAKVAIDHQYPCLILHDVDLLPLDHSNLYVCTSNPRHMSAKIDAYRYVLPYESLVGGALAIRSDQFVELNGYSNKFDNWGGEDAEFYDRIAAKGLEVTRFPPEMSRYSLQRHKRNRRNTRRYKILAENRKMKTREGFDTVADKVEEVKIYDDKLYCLVGVKRKNVAPPPKDSALDQFLSFFID